MDSGCHTKLWDCSGKWNLIICKKKEKKKTNIGLQDTVKQPQNLTLACIAHLVKIAAE
jgi:hypothetical protein